MILSVLFTLMLKLDFVNHCLLYRPVHSNGDQILLDPNSKGVLQWCRGRRIMLNRNESVLLCITNITHSTNHIMGNAPAAEGLGYRYLGITFTTDSKWTKHLP